METFEQPKITGYRQLSETDAMLINSIKAAALAVADLCDKVERLPIEEEYESYENPRRAMAIARSELQSGFMWLIRAVARPRGF